MSGYTVGSLAALFSGGDGGDDAPAKVESSEDDLFTATKKQRDRPAAEITPKRAKKRQKTSSPSAEADLDQSQDEVTSDKKVKRRKKAKVDKEVEDVEGDKEGGTSEGSNRRNTGTAKYEDAKSRQVDSEADARTVFVGNLKSSAKKKKIRSLFSPYGTVKSVRLRCAARPDPAVAKRLAVMKRSFHEARTNICAYVVFSSAEEARKSCGGMDGKEVDGYVIRVDMADHKSGGKVGEGGRADNNPRLGVFVGNLDFGLEENALRDHFSGCGDISSVRLVRDAATGVGKGFGYVNFKEEDAVEVALRRNGSQLKGRAVRVQRCAKKEKGKPATKAQHRSPAGKNGLPKGARGKPKQAKGVKNISQPKKNKKKPENPSFQGRSAEDGKSKKKGKKGPNKSDKKKAAISKKLMASA